MFTDLFGGAPHARVFDFLAEEPSRDRTIMEIARGSGVARPTVYKVVEDFQEEAVLRKTRTVGNSRFFQLDLSNDTVVRLLEVLRPTEFAEFEVGAPAPTEPRARKGRKANRR